MTERMHAITRRGALGLLGAAAFAPGAAFASGTGIAGRAFGTQWRVAGEGLDGLAPGVVELFEGVDLTFSPWRDDSAISRFNAVGRGTTSTDRDLVAVTEAALAIARQSDGAFDPTVGPLVARWGFGPIERGGAPDWRGITTGPLGVGKASATLTLDLCGIAKGFALDRATSLLMDDGVRSALFDLGGEFAAVGRHPSGRDWRVGVEMPVGVRDAVALRLAPGTAVATSGVAAQGFGLGKRRYGHIIDPDARAPAGGPLWSVTVAAADAMSADGWATALFAAQEAGPEMAADLGLAALFLSEDGARPVATAAMRELLL